MRRLALALSALALLLRSPLAEAQGTASTAARATPSASWLPSLSVVVRSGAMQAPDSVASGLTRIHLVKEQGRHIVVVVRLRDGVEPAAFLPVQDSARMTPSTGRASGLPEVVRDGEVVVDLAPGRYVVACVVRDSSSGKRHLSLGESKVIVVKPKRAAKRSIAKAPPVGTEVHMFDFAYRAPDRWKRGAQWVRVSNEGKEDHLLLIARLRDGVTLPQWAAAKPTDSVSVPLTGVARTSPGGVVYLPVALSPGRYVLHCRIQAAATGIFHERMGMFKEIVVE